MANNNSVTRADIKRLLDSYCRGNNAKIVASDVEDLKSRAVKQWFNNFACWLVKDENRFLLEYSIDTVIKTRPFPILGEKSKEYTYDLYVDCDDDSRDFIAQTFISNNRKKKFNIEYLSEEDKHGIIISCGDDDLSTYIASLNRILADKSLKIVGECGKEMASYINPAIHLQPSNYDYMSLLRRTCGALLVSTYGYGEKLDNKYFAYGCSFYRALAKSIEGGVADIGKIAEECAEVITTVFANLKGILNYYQDGVVPDFEVTVKDKKVRVSKEILDGAMRGFLRETYVNNKDFPEYVYNLSLPVATVFMSAQAGK